MHHPTDRTAHTTAFVTPVLAPIDSQMLSIKHISSVKPCAITIEDGLWVVGSITHGGPTEVGLIPASAPRLV